MVSLAQLPAGLTCSNALPATVPSNGLTLNFVGASNLVAGSYTITVQGSAGAATAQSSLALTVTGAAGLSLSMGTTTGYAGQGANVNVLTSSPIGYTGPLWLHFTNLPAGITVSGQPLALIPGAQEVGLNFDPSTVPGNYTLTATLMAGSQSISATSGTITVLPATSIQSNGNDIDIIPGGSATVNIFCQNSSGTSCTLQGSISGLPAGLTVSPAPPWQITTQGIPLTFMAASNLAVGIYPVTITTVGGGSLTLNFHVNNANFTLAGLSQTSQLTVRQAASVSLPFQLILNVLPGGVANFSVDMSVSGLPQGTVASFSPSRVTPGDNTTLTITASANAPVTYGQGLLITATPTNAVLPQSLPLLLNVTPTVGQLAVSRSDFFNVNGSQLSGVLDLVHNQIFVSNPDYNRVDVLSLASKSVIASIPVPEPASVTKSLDGTQIVVGTRTSQVVWIDTSRLQITKTYIVPPIPTNPPTTPPTTQYVHELANGTLLVMPSLMIVDPSNNQLTTPKPPGIGTFDKFAVNDQGTKVVLSTNGTTLSVYDVASATFASISYSPGVSVLGIDSTGAHILVGSRMIDVFDSALNHLGTIDLGQDFITANAFVFSPDGKTAYLDIVAGLAPPIPTIYTMDVPSLTVTGLSSASNGIAFAADQTGLLFGTTAYGVTVDDSSFLIPAPAASAGFVGQLLPSVGPVGQATQTQLGTASFFTLPDVYFGSKPAASEALSNGTFTTAMVTAPSSNAPGPVNVKLVWPNGTEGFLPFGFSYGPSIQAMLTNGGSPAGSSSGSLLALGVPSDPSQIQVTIGGAPATVTGSIALSTAVPPQYPFSLMQVNFTTPPGSGGAADVSLTTSNGTATLKDAFHYATSIQDYAPPVSGTSYQLLLYNSKRNELYLNGGDHIDIFSPSSATFVNSISPAALAGKILSGLALSPDGNKLYIGDTSDGLLLVADLSNLSSSLISIPIAPASQANGCLTGPFSVAVTSDSKAYVSYYTISTNHCSNFAFPTDYQVDLQTNVVSTPSFVISNCRGNFTASGDGNELVVSPISGTGIFCTYDVNGGNIHMLDSNSNLQLGDSANGLAVSADGTRVATQESLIGGWVVATNAGNVINFSHTPAAYSLPVFPLTNMKLTESGSLLYALYPNDLDIFDANHGTLQRRIALTQTAQSVLDSLAIDAGGQHVFAITDKGLTVITLDSVPLSAAELQPSNGPSSAVVTVHGSGFNNQITATLNGNNATVIFVDDSTLQLTIPAAASGMQTLILTNPDGQVYTLEAAFLVQ